MCFKLGMLDENASLPAVPVFRELMNELLPAKEIEMIAARHHSGLGAPARVKVSDLVMGAVYHEFMDEGTKAEHLREVSGVEIGDGSLSQRYLTLDAGVFREVMAATLQPIADPSLDPTAYYEGLLLVGVDGGAFSMANTAAVQAVRRKAKARRGRAAFAKLAFCTVYELAHHQPILAAIDGESEMALARQLWPQLPSRSLCLGDRYYGHGQCIGELIPFCDERGNYFFFRVKEGLNSRIIKRLADGSAIVEVTSAKGVTSQVREIRGKITTRWGRKIHARFWTNLTHARVHTARKLLQLYSQRWEHEIGYDELKNRLHRGELLKSHTPHTAVQEVAALIIAQAVIARIRRRVGHKAGVPSLRVSFRKTRRFLNAFWTLVQVGGSLFSKAKIRALGQQVMAHLETLLTPPRRKRSCPRAVRQPITKWPRLQKNSQAKGEIIHEVVEA
jgi:hypothetical protein